ncbi:MAG: hypothetical protein QM534_10220 [Sediminibacterium sp.]|nr:hypothetical protein [Sediminibacterium sp.]
MHFFTEPSKLHPQVTADAFGPDTTDVNNKYNISSKHIVPAVFTEAKIFACQDAMMLVRPQTGSTTLVNIILKPIGNLEIPFTNVKYYIYRGVDRSSLVVDVPVDANHPNGVAVTSTAGTPTQFISKYWKRWADFKTNTSQPALPDPLPISFGYDTATSGTKLVEELFNSASSSDTTINDFQAIRVSEGEWIANLLPTVNFEFEIITDTDHLTIDLAYVQAAKKIVDATGLLNYELASAWESIQTRDRVLNYVDPAAFFGMYYNAGLKIHNTYDTVNFTNTTTSKQGDLLISDVLSTFLNKDAVYLDIRSERGYSYFHHRNYLSGGSVLELKSESQATFNALGFGNVYWPLINLKSPPASLVPIANGVRIELKLMVLDNTKPLVYLLNPKLLNSANTEFFIKEDQIIDINAGTGLPENLSKIIRLEVPKTSANINVAHHIKLQYFRQEYSATPPVSVFKSTDYLDSVYGGIKQPILNVAGPFQEVINSKIHFVNNGAFSFAAHTGTIVKDSLALFYSENANSLVASGNVFPDINVTNEPDFDGILKRKNAVYAKASVTDGGSPVQIISIVGYNKTSTSATPRENIHLLGLTKTQLDDINTATTSLDVVHKYFIFEIVAGTVGYVKYQLKVQGLDTGGTQQTISTFGGTTNTLYVFGTNTSMLCSAGFATAVNLPISIPDPGTISDFPDFYRYDYDGNDPLVTDLFPGGTIEIDDIGNRLMSGAIDPIAVRRSIGILGEIFYPVDRSGSDVIAGTGIFPVIIINHANGGRYSDYRQLAGHLAKNGFIVSSISCLIARSKVFSGNRGDSFPIPIGGGRTYNIVSPYTNLNYFFFFLDDAKYAFGTDDTNPATFQKLMVLRGVQSTTTILGVDHYTFTYTSDDKLGWKNGIDFEFYATPAPTVWERRGSRPGVGLSKFGLTWNSNIESPPGSFKAVLKKAGTKLVNLTAADWALISEIDVQSAINAASDITQVQINFPSASINKYLGSIIGGKYYMIKIISSTTNSLGSNGTRVVINVEVMNRSLDITFNFDIGRHDLFFLGRSNMVYPHLQILRKFMFDKGWSSKLDNKVGLIGHSRGAEAVVRCASDIGIAANIPRVNITTVPASDPRTSVDKWKYVPDDLFDVKAVISLAPTDFSFDQSESIQRDIPYYVLYGSMEGDVEGRPNPDGAFGSRSNRTCGFSIYDRTTNTKEKAMSFVYGATHNGFITNNFDYLQKYTAFVGNLLHEVNQKNIVLAYMNAFMRLHIKGEPQWRQLFHGTYIPPSTHHTAIYPQFKDMESPLVPANKLILDFQASSASVMYDGTAVTVAGNLQHGDAIELNDHTPHDTKVIMVNWSSGKVLTFDVANKDITAYDFFSLRIGHVVDFGLATYPDLSQTNIKLIDTTNTTSITTLNGLVPPPHLRQPALTKTFFTTLRIPISNFTIGANLTAISKVELIFPAGSGSVLIDDVEFTN